MAAIQVKRVPPELHEALRRRAAAEGMSISDYVLDALQRDLARPTRREWVQRLKSREPVRGPDSIDIVSAIEEERAGRDERLTDW